MSKDGFYFIVLVLFVAWMASALMAVLVAIILLTLTVISLPLLFTALINGLKASGVKLPASFDAAPTEGLPIEDNTLPREFIDLERAMFSKLGTSKEAFDTIIFRFLTLVKVYDAGDMPLPYLQNGIAKKMMYEYHRKYGTLEYKYNATDTLSFVDVLRPIEPGERPAFHTFCALH